MRYCSECKKEKMESYCQSCKKDTSNNYVLEALTETIRLRMPAISMTHKRPGIKRFLKKVITGFKSSVDTIKHPDGINLNRVIDRENNKYEETVVDNITGKIVRDIKEPLDQHTSSRQKNIKQIDQAAGQFAEILVASIDEKKSLKNKDLPYKSDSDM